MAMLVKVPLFFTLSFLLITNTFAQTAPVYPKGPLEGIKLQFIFPEELDTTKFAQNRETLTKKVYLDTVIDMREKPNTIGINKQKVPARTVTVSDTVSQWVKSSFETIFTRFGISVVANKEDADVIFSAVIHELFTTETGDYITKASIEMNFSNSANEKLLGKKVNTETSAWGKSYSSKIYFTCISEILTLASETVINDGSVREILR